MVASDVVDELIWTTTFGTDVEVDPLVNLPVFAVLK